MLRDPFTVEDEVSLYVPRPASEEALAGLRGAVRAGTGAVVLLGPVGIGKSLVLKVLETSLSAERCCVRVEYQGLSAVEFCQWILRELDARETLETERVLSHRPTLARFRDWVQRERSYAETEDPEQGLVQLACDFQTRGFAVLVLIDAADTLKPETARRLIDLSQRANGALCFVFALTEGMPETDAVIESLGSSKVVVPYRTPMTLDETVFYLKERLTRAHASQELIACLDESRIRRIYKYTQGNPRRLHGEVGLIHLELSRVRAGISTAPAYAPPAADPAQERPWLASPPAPIEAPTPQEARALDPAPRSGDPLPTAPMVVPEPPLDTAAATPEASSELETLAEAEVLTEYESSGIAEPSAGETPQGRGPEADAQTATTEDADRAAPEPQAENDAEERPATATSSPLASATATATGETTPETTAAESAAPEPGRARGIFGRKRGERRASTGKRGRAGRLTRLWETAVADGLAAPFDPKAAVSEAEGEAHEAAPAEVDRPTAERTPSASPTEISDEDREAAVAEVESALRAARFAASKTASPSQDTVPHEDVAPTVAPVEEVEAERASDAEPEAGEAAVAEASPAEAVDTEAADTAAPEAAPSEAQLAETAAGEASEGAPAALPEPAPIDEAPQQVATTAAILAEAEASEPEGIESRGVEEQAKAVESALPSEEAASHATDEEPAEAAVREAGADDSRDRPADTAEAGSEPPPVEAAESSQDELPANGADTASWPDAEQAPLSYGARDPETSDSDRSVTLFSPEAGVTPELLAEAQRDWEQLTRQATRLSDIRLPDDLIPLPDTPAIASSPRWWSSMRLTSVLLATVGLCGLAIALSSGRGDPPPVGAPGDTVSAAAPPAPLAEIEPTPEPDEPAPIAPAPSILVNVNAKPWATIEVDGEPVGETPLGELPLSEGPHAFRATLPSGRVIERTEMIGPDNTRIVFE